jgi:type IX secretion system PorP/SprF family membrane protein
MCSKFNFSILLFFIFLTSIAQEGIPIYHDYLTDNYYLVHPSMAGAANCDKLRLTGRKQWFGYGDAPELQTLSYNMRVAEKSGAGIIIFNDKNGYHSQKGVKLTYAHHLLFSRDEIDLNQLSFGINTGFIQTQLDKSLFIDFDPIVSDRFSKNSIINFDVGVSYNFLNFYTHVTVQGLFNSQRKLSDSIDMSNNRNYLFSAGYVFRNEETYLLEPSILFQLIDKTNEKKLDMNLKIYKELAEGAIWGGISYRVDFDRTLITSQQGAFRQKLQYFTPFFGVNYKNLMVGYTYSKLSGSLLFDSGGYHQITLGFNLFCRPVKYDCYCPAVN